mmetsp:Transcript_115589/g.188375  ORF Transcript_115589/g.188375 Transcript_115589/m.188375 type:complete len:383 (+) Transcript_115589:527-1675(+)
MVVLLLGTPIPPPVDPGSQLLIVRSQATRIAVSAEVLARVQGETAHITYGANTSAFVESAVRLRSILNHHKIVPFCNIKDCVHVTAMTIQMHRHDGFGLRCDRGLKLAAIKHVVLIMVDEDWGGTVVRDGKHRSNERVCLHNHLIARANVKELDCKVQCIGAGVEADAVLVATPCRKFVLKFLDVWPKDECSLVQNVANACPHLIFDAEIIGLQIYQRDVCIRVHLETVMRRNLYPLTTLFHGLLNGLQDTHHISSKSCIRHRLAPLPGAAQKVAHLILQRLRWFDRGVVGVPSLQGAVESSLVRSISHCLTWQDLSRSLHRCLEYLDTSRWIHVIENHTHARAHQCELTDLLRICPAHMNVGYKRCALIAERDEHNVLHLL